MVVKYQLYKDNNNKKKIIHYLNLTFRKLQESRKFAKEEEKLYFSNENENVLCLLKNGEYAILYFNFMYHSFKSNKNGEFLRDGNGETIWENENNEYCNNADENYILGWYRLYN